MTDIYIAISTLINICDNNALENFMNKFLSAINIYVSTHNDDNYYNNKHIMMTIIYSTCYKITTLISNCPAITVSIELSEGQKDVMILSSKNSSREEKDSYK